MVDASLGEILVTAEKLKWTIDHVHGHISPEMAPEVFALPVILETGEISAQTGQLHQVLHGLIHVLVDHNMLAQDVGNVLSLQKASGREATTTIFPNGGPKVDL